MEDPVTPLIAKAKLRFLHNEVRQWYSCYADQIEANPPHDVFAKNAYVRSIYKHAADWSLRITQAMQSTVKPSIKNAENSPKSSLPRAWFDQIAGAMEREISGIIGTSMSISTTASEPPAATPAPMMEPGAESAGNLNYLIRIGRKLSAGGGGTVPNAFSDVSNEVSKMLGARGAGSVNGVSGIEASDALSNDERDDNASQSFPPNESSENSFYATNNVGASTIGSQSSKLALEAFRRLQFGKKTDQWGYLTIPKSLLACHPSLPAGVKDTVVLVNAAQPTSIVAYSLCSKQYTQRLNAFIRKEAIQLDGPLNSIESTLVSLTSSSASSLNVGGGSAMSVGSSSEATLLRMLRSMRRNNVDHVFVDENQFQPATRFSCKSYYAMQFHALRRLYYGGDRNFVESLCTCEQWNAAGGKSGAGFLKTRDQRFIAKAIPEMELQMFLSMANEYFGYMAKTFENNLSSMLSKVLGVYKVTSVANESEQRLCVIVMENLLYGRDIDFSFDLKGKMEGRYKDPAKIDVTVPGVIPVLWDRNFVEMAGGIPLPLQESAMSLLLSAIANDTAFLASVQATDYSMLVGYDVRKQEVVASIIDYIHKYDFLKMVEHAGKRLIQDEGEITVLNPRQYRKRFCIAMTKVLCHHSISVHQGHEARASRRERTRQLVKTTMRV
ncbi:hypothetical protein PINS_up013346 [Pythium insidiosum]|nr:hypothetical protein PINS_up013346 [Pythium insidiosum]